MSANRIAVNDIEVMLRPGLVPAIVLQGVELRDAAGGLRAAFPRVSVTLDRTALLRRELRPSQVRIVGAGLRMRRDADGRLDLELASGGGANAVSLQETLARIDAMFAAPVFDRLEDVSGDGLTLDMDDAITGQTMRVRDATMDLGRKNGSLALNFSGRLEGTRESDVTIAVTRDAPSRETEIYMDFTDLAARDVATVTPALAWLDLMRAPISGAITARLADDGTLGDLRIGLEIGAGVFNLGEGVRVLPFDAMGVDLQFATATQRLQFDRLDLEASELSFSATGHADLLDGGRALVAQLQLADIAADPEGVFDVPLSIDGGAIDLRLTLAPTVQVDIGQAVLFDGPLRLQASGRVAVEREGLRMSIDAQVPDVNARDVLPYWPTAAIPNTRNWLDANMIDGQLSGVDLALRAVPGQQLRSVLQMDFSDATLRALPALAPITDARGYLTLSGPRLVMAMEAGTLAVPDGATLALHGSTMVIERVDTPGPMADFDLHVDGALTDVLRLLNGPPVNIFAQGGMTPEMIGTGQAALAATVSTRLLRGQQLADMDVAVTGTVTDFRSDSLVPDRLLTAESITVDVSNTAVLVSGRALLDDVPVTGTWQRAIGAGAAPGSVVDARAPLNRAVLETFGVSLPADMISGSSTADLRLRLRPDGPPRLSVTSDLAGLGLSISPLRWRLDQGETGLLTAEVVLGDAPDVPVLSLTGAGMDMAGAVSLRPGGGLDRLSITQLRIGTWLDVTGALVGRGGNTAPAVEVTGGSFDLRNAPAATASAANAGGGGPLSVALDRIQITQGAALTGVRADLTTVGGLSGQFQALVNGAAPVTGTLVTTDDGLAVRLRSDDGGAVLRAAGLFQGGYGGDLTLILVPTGETGTYDGQLTINGPRLRDAPAMAELLNLISVVGLLEQLGGEGINLGDVEARFRLTPRAVFLSQGAAVGPSMGVSLDGVYDIANDQLEMQGVLSPLYVVNGLIGALFAPRREGLFGFSYQLTGSSRAPDVAVNPLSILTPGIFREIFRRPPPELQELSQ